MESTPLSLVSCEALSSILLFLDRESLISLRKTCLLMKFVVQWTQMAVNNFDYGTETVPRAIPLEQWRARSYPLPRQLPLENVKNLMSMATQNTLLSPQQGIALLELACLAAKRHYAVRANGRRNSTNPPGNYLCSPATHTLMPPHFHHLLGELSYPPVSLRPNAVEIARLVHVPMCGDEDDDDSVEMRPRGSIHSNLVSSYYNTKQDLLNQIADTIENQFDHCARVLRYSTEWMSGPTQQTVGESAAIQAVASVQRESAGVASPVLHPAHIAELLRHGITVVDNILDPQLCTEVHNTAQNFVMKSLQLENLSPEELDEMEMPPYFMMQGDPPEARGDLLMWIRKQSVPGSIPPLANVLARHDQIETEVATLANITGNRESQLAMYLGNGIGYTRHRDAFPDDGSESNDNRKITAITYCTSNWRPEHGGRLRVWLSRRDKYRVVDVDPLPGRLVLFMSGVLDHEVQPSYSPRTAITSWYW